MTESDASRFSTRPEQRIDHIRNSAIRDVIELKIAGETDLSYRLLWTAFRHQAMLLGIRDELG